MRLKLGGFEWVAVGLRNLEVRMAVTMRLRWGSFEWATAGLGKLGTWATAVGLNLDGGAWGQLKQKT